MMCGAYVCPSDAMRSPCPLSRRQLTPPVWHLPVQVLELPPAALPLQVASFTALETWVVREARVEGAEAAWDAILFGLR